MLTFSQLLNSKEQNRKKKKYFPDHWLAKGYLEHRAYYLAEKFYTNTISDYDLQLTKCATTWNKNFWLSRGYTEEESIKQVKLYQRKNSIKKLEKYTDEERKKFNSSCIEYYLNKGFLENEARLLLSKRQSTFSLEKCLEKHGENGLKVFNARQEKWQKTLNSKSKEEKELINAKKGITLNNYIKKYGKEEGTKKYFEWVQAYKLRLERNGRSPFSLESLQWFKSFIPSYIFDNAQFGENEYYLHDGNKLFFYDFKFKNTIVEYHGHLYHFNPKVKNLEWKNPFGYTKNQSLEKDKAKRELAISNGFTYFEFYSNDSKECEDQIKFQILKALHEEINH